MATPQKFAPVQDLPPKGGYPFVNLARKLGNRGPPGWAIWLGFTVITAYGFYQVGQTNGERRLNKKEKREARMAIVPELQAQNDRMRYKKMLASQKEEAALMAFDPNWKVGESAYNTRWMEKRR